MYRLYMLHVCGVYKGIYKHYYTKALYNTYTKKHDANPIQNINMMYTLVLALVLGLVEVLGLALVLALVLAPVLAPALVLALVLVPTSVLALFLALAMPRPPFLKYMFKLHFRSITLMQVYCRIAERLFLLFHEHAQ